MATKTHKGPLVECPVCSGVQPERKFRRKKTTGLTAEISVRRQATAELGEEPTRFQKDAVFQKYGIHDPVIDRNVKKPSWKSEVVWKNELKTWEQRNRGAGAEAKIPRVASGLHSEDSVIDTESGLPTEAEVPESPESPVSEPPNAVITPEGVQELPPWLIGSDGKPLPINERTLRLIRGKTFTVRHILLTCGHKMDMQNQPENGVRNLLVAMAKQPSNPRANCP